MRRLALDASRLRSGHWRTGGTGGAGAGRAASDDALRRAGRLDREGRPAFQFFLKDAFGTLKVLSRTQVEEGDQVIVEGTFTRRRQSGRITVYNEVNASSVRPLNQFDPDLVG